jgi:hypothetical protein
MLSLHIDILLITTLTLSKQIKREDYGSAYRLLVGLSTRYGAFEETFFRGNQLIGNPIAPSRHYLGFGKTDGRKPEEGRWQQF